MTHSRLGVGLTLAGAILVIVSFFSPWFEVYKLNDPSYVFPRRGYSPWMALQSGSLNAVAWLFLLLTLGMALSGLALAFAHTARRRSQAQILVGGLAVVNLLLIAFVVPGISFNLSFDWPHLNSDVVYGVYLAVAGCLSALIGLALLSPVDTWQ